MKFITQTIFGPPDGNCHAAALANLLGVELEFVPDVSPSADMHLVVLDEWMRNRFGLTWLMVPVSECDKRWTMGDVPHLASGMGPRRFRHTVVMKGVEMVWDPHPSRDGLESIDTHWYLVPLDPGLLWM